MIIIIIIIIIHGTASYGTASYRSDTYSINIIINPRARMRSEGLL